MRRGAGEESGRPGTLDRGLSIIDRLAVEDRPMTVKQLANDLNLPSSTLYRLLGALESRGLVSYHLANYVTLGPVLMDLGLLARRDFDRTIGSQMRPLMYELAQEHQESVVLMMPAGQRAVCVEYIPSSRPIHLAFEVGRAMPLYAGAACKVILAHLEEPRRGAVVAGCESSVRADGIRIDPRALVRELEAIRATGACFTEDEVNPGTAGVSVPVRLGRDIIGSLTLAGPRPRFTPHRVDRMTMSLTKAALLCMRRLTG
jgi:DNA-binding IclR family transcriptional regulator